MRLKYVIFAAAMMSCIWLQTASATTYVRAQLDSVGPGLGAIVTGGGVVGEGAIAGSFNFHQVPGIPAANEYSPPITTYVPYNIAVGSPFSSACIDLKQVIGVGWIRTWAVVDPLLSPIPGPGGGYMSLLQVNDLRKLYKLYDPLGGGFTTNLEAAAFHAAVWEIVWEKHYTTPNNAYDITTGSLIADFDADPNVAARANYMLGPSGIGGASLDTAPTLVALVNPIYQDQIMFATAGERLIPEPLTVIGVFSGLCGLAGYVRKRTRA